MVQFASRMDLLKGSEIRELLKLTAQPDRTYDTHHRRNHNRQPKLGQPDQMAGGIV